MPKGRRASVAHARQHQRYRHGAGAHCRRHCVAARPTRCNARPPRPSAYDLFGDNRVRRKRNLRAGVRGVLASAGRSMTAQQISELRTEISDLVARVIVRGRTLSILRTMTVARQALRWVEGDEGAQIGRLLGSVIRLLAIVAGMKPG